MWRCLGNYSWLTRGLAIQSGVRDDHPGRSPAADVDAEGAFNDPEYEDDAEIVCWGYERSCSCRWRNGEFDDMTDSQQLELEAANTAVSCSRCNVMWHWQCVGGGQPAPEEDEAMRWWWAAGTRGGRGVALPTLREQEG
jgi:hypothetical protein